MNPENVILQLEDVQKELTQTLVDGVEDYPQYREIKGKINGMAVAITIIQKALEDNDISSTEDDKDD